MARKPPILQTQFPYHLTCRTNNKSFRFERKKAIKIFALAIYQNAEKVPNGLFHRRLAWVGPAQAQNPAEKKAHQGFPPWVPCGAWGKPWYPSKPRKFLAITWDRQQLAALFRREDYSAGDTITEAGIRGGFFAVIGSGLVELRDADGHITRVKPGQAFGEAMLRHNVPSTITASAVKNSMLWMLDREDWLPMANLPPELSISEKKSAPQKKWRKPLLALIFLLIVLVLISPAITEFASVTLPNWMAESGRSDLAVMYLDAASQLLPGSDRIWLSMGYAKSK